MGSNVAEDRLDELPRFEAAFAVVGPIDELRIRATIVAAMNNGLVRRPTLT